MPVIRRFGAFPALCAAALLTVACSTMTPRPSAQRAADDGLAEGVYAALNADRVHFYRHVDVRVEDGVADLSGYVWSAEAIYRAREIALGVAGVRRVVTSHLELQRDGTRNGRTR